MILRLGGGFLQSFWIFIPIFGEMIPNLTVAYFGNGVAQPPASIGNEKTWDPPFSGRFGKSSTQKYQ